MKRLFAAALVSLLSFGSAAAQGPQPIAGGLVADVMTWKSVVLDISQTNRHITVRGPQGRTQSFVVRQDTPGFDKIKKGDTVSVSFVESVALYLRESNDPPEAASYNKVTVQPKGLPAISDVAVQEAVVKVTAMDTAMRSLTVVGPKGNAYTFHVDPSVKAYSKVKVGDNIDVRYSEAVAIQVTK